MNNDQKAFLGGLTVHELCQLVDDLYYQAVAAADRTWLGTKRHQNYVRAVKLGLSGDNGALVGSILMWRLHYTSV